MNSREVLSHFAKENHLRDGDPPEKISLSLLDHLISIVENSGKMWKVYGKYVRTTSANYKMDFAMALCPFPEVSHRGEFGSKRPISRMNTTTCPSHVGNIAPSGPSETPLDGIWWNIERPLRIGISRLYTSSMNFPATTWYTNSKIPFVNGKSPNDFWPKASSSHKPAPPRPPLPLKPFELQAACLKNVKLRLRVNFPNAGNLDRVGISRTLQ